MSAKRRRDPKEKKALSYAKDRRNTYRENSKASRKGVPARKRSIVKAQRRHAHQSLAVVSSDTSAEQWVTNEVKAADKPLGRWRKSPDKPLGEVIKNKLVRRKRVGMLGA